MSIKVRSHCLLAVSADGVLANKTLAKKREGSAHGLATGASTHFAEVLGRSGLLRN